MIKKPQKTRYKSQLVVNWKQCESHMHTQLPSIVSDNNDQLNLKKLCIQTHSNALYNLVSFLFSSAFKSAQLAAHTHSKHTAMVWWVCVKLVKSSDFRPVFFLVFRWVSYPKEFLWWCIGMCSQCYRKLIF